MTTLITPSLTSSWSRKRSVVVVVVDGCKGISVVELTVHEFCLKADIIVVDNINKFIDIIGLNLTNQLVGVIIEKDTVEFGCT